MNYRVLLAVILLLSGIGISVCAVADGSDADSVPDQPSYDYSYCAITGTYYQDSSSVSFYLSNMGQDASGYATLIGGSHMQGNLTVDDSGLPSWITYTLYSNRYDVSFTISPGAECDDVFWVLFSCFGGDDKILITFDINVIDDGSGVINGDDLNIFTLYFDSNGGSSVSTMSAQSSGSSYAFNLSSAEPTRSGYKFVGWSSVDDSTVSDVGSSWILTLSGSSTTVTDTLYAIWEVSEDWTIIYTIWDYLCELLNDPLFLMFIVGCFLVTCLFIRKRMRRY